MVEGYENMRLLGLATLTSLLLCMSVACQSAMQPTKALSNGAYDPSAKKSLVPVDGSKTVTSPAESIAQKLDEVVIVGRIVGSGISRGKTLAAWNGIPTRERFFRLAIQREEPDGKTRTRTVFLRVPTAFQDKSLTGQDVRLLGRWTQPRPMDSGQPANGLQQMPIQQMPIQQMPIQQMPIQQMPIQPVQMPIRPVQMPMEPSQSLKELADTDAPNDPEAKKEETSPHRPSRISTFVPVPRVSIFVAREVMILQSKAPTLGQ
jgi:hypothetical protein